MAEHTRAKFDLTAEPPLRVALFALTPTESVLSIVIHHIAVDGLSVEPLLRDLATAYTARLAGDEPRWTPLPVQYGDYALWQREVLGQDDDPDSLLSARLAFWRQALEGLPEQQNLPVARPRPAVASHRGDVVGSWLPAALHADLVSLAKAHRVSLFMVLQAALTIVLSRVGAGRDLAIGTSVGGRPDPVLDDLVGVFLNTLVLRADVSGNPSVSDLLGRIRSTDLAAYAHQDTPFERLVEALNPQRSPSYNPLFQVMLELHHGAEPTPALPGVQAAPYPLTYAAAKVDLSFTLRERYTQDGRPAGLEYGLEYATDLFDRATAQRLSGWFRRVLEQAAADPSRPIGELAVLSEGERLQILREWNATDVPMPDATLSGLFEEQVARRPDAVALIDADGSEISYDTLNKRANRLAHHLRAIGVTCETFVAVYAEHSPDLLTALLGVLKAGGAYVPLDPHHPTDRLAHILRDTGAAIVLTQRALADRLPSDYHGTVITLEDRQRDTLHHDTDLPPVHGPGNLVYAMYTSGSTGWPKGVLITHHALLNYLRWAIDGYGVEGDHGAPMLGSAAVDLSIPNFFLPSDHRQERHAATTRPPPGTPRRPATPTRRLQPAQNHTRPPRHAARSTHQRHLTHLRPHLRRRSRRTTSRNRHRLATDRPPRPHHQRIRTHRNRRRLFGASHRAGPRPVDAGPHRAADRQHPHVRPRRAAPAGAARRRRRALCRRPRGRARLPAAVRADGRAVRRRSLRRTGKPDVPYRRPGPLPARRRPRLPRPDRPPGEDPRLPGRTR